MKNELLFSLLEQFDKSNLVECKYKTADFSIVLRKAFKDSSTPVIHSPTVPLQTQAPSGTVQTPQETNPKRADTEIITSPLVGTFYRSPSPDSPPFFDEGSTVKSGETIAIIEAMKILNELEAEFDLEIVNILVENGTMLEFGTPIFEVKRI